MEERGREEEREREREGGREEVRTLTNLRDSGFVCGRAAHWSEEARECTVTSLPLICSLRESTSDE